MAGEMPATFLSRDDIRMMQTTESAPLAADEGAPAASSVESGVRELQGLLEQRRFAETLERARALALEVPENRDVLYLMAVAQRYLERIPDSLQTLAQLERLHPGFSRLYQERGHCHVYEKNAAAAIDAFLRAVNINPALPVSWKMLEGLYRMTGQAANAKMAAGHVATLAHLPPAVVQATALFSDGDLEPAEQITRDFLLRNGDEVEAMRLLARIGLARDVLDDAEILLAAVLKRAPDYAAARADYARVLLERHKYAAAREQVEQLLRREPGDRALRTMLANAFIGLGEHDRAISLFRELLPGAINPEDLHLSIAHALKTMGHSGEAVEAYRAAAQARPSFGDAYWSLANLKTYRFTEHEIARMRVEEASPGTAPMDRYHLCFALGKALEDQEQFEESWRFYERGNAIMRAQSRYRPELQEQNTRLQREVCTAQFFRAREAWGTQEADPIFILGLPRSGSTLLEQILASHPQVEGTQELGEIPRLAFELQGRNPDLWNPRYPGVLAQLDRDAVRRLGQRYLAETRAFRHGRPFFIDKNPNNFRHIGLIHLILPNAKIIDARREPMACCFSNLKQLFARGQEFTYCAEDIARYYRTYLDLMRHWDEVLPGRVLRVQHEDVVEDLEGNVRKLLDFCGLEFDPACVEFHRTERSVRTASSEQVRQPIFREGLEQWRHYEPWLGPLRDCLGDALIRYRLN
jgi:tetratricopeptide (TPR) repeat protein